MSLPGTPVPVPDVAAVEDELREFWRQGSSETHPALKACTHNLVAVCSGASDRDRATETIAGLSDRHPGRAIVVSRRPEAGLGAWVSAHCHLGPGDRLVCAEQVTLEAGEDAIDLLPETVLQLLVEEAPVFTWWRPPSLADDPLFGPLARLASRIIVDVSHAGEVGDALRDLARLDADPSWTGCVGDLAWVRTEPWRELVASFFDSPATRPYLDAITAVEVAAGGPAAGNGVTVSGAYLVGWLASRLGWRPAGGDGSFRSADGDEISVRLERDDRFDSGRTAHVLIEAAATRRPARFVVHRAGPNEDRLQLRMEMKEACPLPYSQPLRVRDEVTLLGGEIERDAGDAVYREALAAAANLAMTGE
jgi:glucose-6-phosphate dehydrogenase assembly protein OpcA